ncbi:hypothetical protein H0H93_009784 [Arthromyces matolae]|nr:hypothetical protein H0H93_009784 [Arthromyces matolae]
MTTPRSTFVKVLTFPVLVKCGRLASISLFLRQMNQTNGQGSIAILAGQLWFRNPYMISEWSLQVADNLYSTLFLFWKLRKFYRGSETGFRVQSRSLLARLRGIFVIALANFVFPLFMNVTQLVLIVRDKDYARGTEVLFANLYISIVGVLFATVWASGRAWGHSSTSESSDISSFHASIGSTPGYIRNHTNPGSRSFGSETRVGGRHKLQSPYDLSTQDSQGFGRSFKEGIHVEQVVLKDVKTFGSQDV